MSGSTEGAKAICEGCGEIVVPLSLCKACGSFAAVTVRLGSEDYCECGASLKTEAEKRDRVCRECL